jgi:hypothetical protein
MTTASEDQPHPVNVIKSWEDFVEVQVYPVPAAKAKSDYRNYDKPARETVREFYRENHRYQTYDFVRQKRDEFLKLDRRQMSIFEALDFLNTRSLTTQTRILISISFSTCCKPPNPFARMDMKTGLY